MRLWTSALFMTTVVAYHPPPGVPLHDPVAAVQGRRVVNPHTSLTPNTSSLTLCALTKQ